MLLFVNTQQTHNASALTKDFVPQYSSQASLCRVLFICLLGKLHRNLLHLPCLLAFFRPSPTRFSRIARQSWVTQIPTRQRSQTSLSDIAISKPSPSKSRTISLCPTDLVSETRTRTRQRSLIYLNDTAISSPSQSRGR